MRRRPHGFTLLEVLVAISIFALIGVASYRVLSSVLQTNERLEARSAELRRVNRAFWLIQQDVEQMIRRPVRGADGSAQPYLEVGSGDPPLEFTRTGRDNPLGLPRSRMLRVAYRVGRHPDFEVSGSPHYHEERRYLLRYTWPQLDGSGDLGKALVQALLPDIEKLSATVMTDRGPMTTWPQLSQAQQREPLALQIELTDKDAGVVRRLYKVF